MGLIGPISSSSSVRSQRDRKSVKALFQRRCRICLGHHAIRTQANQRPDITPLTESRRSALELIGPARPAADGNGRSGKERDYRTIRSLIRFGSRDHFVKVAITVTIRIRQVFHRRIGIALVFVLDHVRHAVVVAGGIKGIRNAVVVGVPVAFGGVGDAVVIIVTVAG
jgi:hypothetical protein